MGMCSRSLHKLCNRTSAIPGHVVPLETGRSPSPIRRKEKVHIRCIHWVPARYWDVWVQMKLDFFIWQQLVLPIGLLLFVLTMIHGLSGSSYLRVFYRARRWRYHSDHPVLRPTICWQSSFRENNRVTEHAVREYSTEVIENGLFHLIYQLIL